MTYTVAGTQVIESDAKIDWNKLTGTPAYWNAVAADESSGGTYAGGPSDGTKYVIDDIGSRTLALRSYINITDCNCNCNCFCDGGE